MQYSLYSLILGPMVYLAVGVFLAGTAWRIIRVLKRPAFAPTLAVYRPGPRRSPSRLPSWLLGAGDALMLPTVFRHNARLWLALMLFHVGLAALALGHLELFAEIRALQAFPLGPHAVFLGKGLVGLTMLACLLFFGARRLVSPTKDLSVPEDYLLLALLFLTVLFGSQLDWARAWFGYETMSVVDYRAWLQGLLALRPMAGMGGVTGAGHSFMLVAHVFLANVLLMVFPFTKLMHAMFTFALNAVRRG